jgi:putative ATP-dependent endonuclease of OLD family
LRLDDFWDGLPRPLTTDDVIEISAEFRGFEKSENLLAVLADHLVKPDPMVARIAYRYQPVAGLGREPKSESDYEFVIFGGGRADNTVGYDLRRSMPLDLFPALRDAESDLARWSRSPLRPLLDLAAQTVDTETLKIITKEVHKTTSKIAALPELADVVEEVNDQLTEMVGSKHAVETALGFAPTEADRLLRALQLLIDGGKRGVAEASLGSANVLYLALKELEHQYLVDEGERQHGFRGSRSPDPVRGTVRDGVLQRRSAGRRDWDPYGSGRATRRRGMDGSAPRSTTGGGGTRDQRACRVEHVPAGQIVSVRDPPQ